jgi:hypothetical protein
MITPRVTYLAAAALIGILAASVPVTISFTNDIGETGMHGPVGAFAAIPFVVIFMLGSIVLGVIVIRSRMAAVPTAIGLLPLFILLAGGGLLFIILASIG